MPPRRALDVCERTANVDWVRALGADEVIDYRTQDFATALPDYDLVLDSISGETLAKSLHVVRPGGQVIGIGGPPDPAFAGQLGKPLLRPVMALLSRKIRRLGRRDRASYAFLFMRGDGAQLRQITALVDAGVAAACRPSRLRLRRDRGGLGLRRHRPGQGQGRRQQR